ncbi:hypothetical protein BJ165DRAFT_1530146 [Panaeolus papilionaceus]|nr:hypothetical protein BJ165DRAFT_1530146 [Panaeolus papilionaceus]
MTTLIVGGTGNTGFALAKLFEAAGRPSLLTSRSGEVPEPFRDPSITGVYMIAPFATKALPIVKPSLYLAVEKGVKKFVLIATMMTNPGGGGPFADDIYQYFIDIAVDYTVLRATWYMENFKRNYLDTIKGEGYVYSCSGDGKSPFVSTADVAKAAFEALTTSTNNYSRQAPYVFGPEALSYDEIDHKKLPVEERRDIYLSVLPQEYTDALIAAELDMGAGKEEQSFKDPDINKIIRTTTYEQYFRQNVLTW